jgi:hypothetical protein
MHSALPLETSVTCGFGTHRTVAERGAGGPVSRGAWGGLECQRVHKAVAERGTGGPVRRGAWGGPKVSA